MGLFEFFIHRRVFSTVMSLLVVLIGLVSYSRLSVREYPNIDEPIVSVRTEYLGASAEIIESQVTQVLEGSIAGIEGIETLTSSGEPEESRFTVRFRLGTDPDVPASDVRDRVSRVRGRLPEEIEEPVIAKVEADAQAIIYIAFTSNRHRPPEISDYADRFVRDRLQNLPGVAEVRIFGERRYAMRIWLDRSRLAAYDLTEEGVEPMRAAIRGMGEISSAVIAMTLSLAAVYAPVAFAPGRTGTLFAEFALTLAGAVLVSGFVALTLTPMMVHLAAARATGS